MKQCGKPKNERVEQGLQEICGVFDLHVSGMNTPKVVGGGGEGGG